MKIGIDISQTAFEGTGVSQFLLHFVQGLLEEDQKNDYILFFSSLRNTLPSEIEKLTNNNKRVVIKSFPFPPTLLDLLWNRLHIMPIEQLIGDIDVFITSDWTEPPVTRAKKMTILYDLIVYKFPKETDNKIVTVQKRKLSWAVKETAEFFCISQSTKKDASDVLGIDEKKLKVIYPGMYI